MKNPVMFVVEAGAALTTVSPAFGRSAARAAIDTWASTVQIALWLWVTVLFANFAEGGGGSVAARRRRRRCVGRSTESDARSPAGAWFRMGDTEPAAVSRSRVAAPDLKRGDFVLRGGRRSDSRATARWSMASRLGR